MIFDTHAHYDDEAFDKDRDEIFGQFAEYEIGRVVDPGSTRESIDKIVDLTHRYPFLYGALGIHPSECQDMTEDWIGGIRRRLRGTIPAAAGGAKGTVSAEDVSSLDAAAAEETERKMFSADTTASAANAEAASIVPGKALSPAHDPKMVAVGEIGLDYHWDEPVREVQQHWFRRQIQLAIEEDLPIIVHSRDAAADTLRILKEENAARVGGVIHCYSYSAEMALEFVKMGFYIGIGGVVTFRNGRRMKETVAAVPIGRILLETDSPYLAPMPYRGKRNSSLYLPYVVQAVAEIRGMTPEEVIKITEHNAETMYRL